jgi:hypothetical protein
MTQISQGESFDSTRKSVDLKGKSFDSERRSVDSKVQSIYSSSESGDCFTKVIVNRKSKITLKTFNFSILSSQKVISSIAS